MTNSIEWVVSALAVVRLGAVPVPVNTFLKADEIRYFATQSGARHLIMLDAFRKLDMIAMLQAFCPSTDTATMPGFLCDPEVTMLANGGALVFTEAFNPEQSISSCRSRPRSWLRCWARRSRRPRSRATSLSRRCAWQAFRGAVAAQVATNVDRAFAAFGLTETYAPCSLIGYEPGGKAFAGMMLDGNEARIIDPDTGQEQPPGVPRRTAGARQHRARLLECAGA